jgi:hypothetical protein
VIRSVSMRESLEWLGRAAHMGSRVLTAATASLAIASLVLTTACYTYEARTSSDVLPDQRVVAVLNNRGRVALTPVIGDDAATLEGNMVSATADTVRMRLDQASYLSGSVNEFGGVDIVVPSDGITVFSTKRFSRSKTVALIAGATAAIIGAIVAFGLAGIGGSGNDTKPPNPPASQ